MFPLTVFNDIALFHLLDLSNSNIEHARSNSSEPFIQMAPITQKQLSGEMVIAINTPKTRVRTIPADE
jgi:hypothetical protein